jgi:hypothetical protein
MRAAEKELCMTRKPHNIVWHKKKSKFMAASLLKPHSQDKQSEETPQTSNPCHGRTRDLRPGPVASEARPLTLQQQNKMQVFAKNLARQIKQAVKDTV